MSVVPIHNHSQYSNLDGFSKISEIADRCELLGCPCCGLTDHHTVAGHLEFAKVMTARGIKPIFGAEVYHGVKTEFGKNERDASHLILGALNDTGLRNLWNLMDASADNFRFVSRINWDLLEKYSEGLFATSACALGLVSKEILRDEYNSLNRYLQIFGDRFFMEIHTYPGDKSFREGDDGEPVNQRIINERLVELAGDRGIGLVYANDAHFAAPEQYEYHDAYLAKQMGQSIYTPIEQRRMWHPKALYIQSVEEIRENLSYLPTVAVEEAIANSVLIGEQCSADLPEIKRHLPIFVPKDCPWVEKERSDLNAAELFIQLVEDGIAWRYGDNPSDEVWDRAAMEMEVFIDAGLEHYFLLGWDLFQYCNSEDIGTGPGRGSSAGCIIAYVLGITDVCPLKYELVFERFFNAGREDGFPDIDSDFPRAKRRDILHYLERRWGKDRVRTIGTITRMKPKAVIKAFWSTCGLTWDEKEALKAIVDEVPDLEILGHEDIGWSEDTDPGKTIYVMSHVGDKILAWLQQQPEDRQELIATFLDICEVLCSRIENHGMHPSGIVISDVDLADELPSRWNKNEELRVTQFAMNDVDGRKFIKYDVLGLRTLDTLDEWRRLMKAKGLDFDWHGMEDLDHDEEMWEMYDRGLTRGFFQIEDGYARHLCKELKPRSVLDLAAIVALNRPGPIRAKTPESFITRRLGGDDDQFDGRNIELLKDTLEPTYGWFLYQEQVIEYFNNMNYTLSESDAVRKILGKKKPVAMRQLKTGEGEWKGKGYMQVAPNYVNGQAELIWDKLENFAKYSFNKSHAVAYGLNTFRTNFAAYYGTVEFIIACIRTNPSKSGAYVDQARRLGVTVMPPDILLSDVTVNESTSGDIHFGLSNVKGVGIGAAEIIIDIRSRYDITCRDDLEAALLEESKVWSKRKKEAKDAGQPFAGQSPKQVCKSNQIDALWNAGAFDNYEERSLSLREIQNFQRELLGVIVTDDTNQIIENNSDAISECDHISATNEPWEGEDTYHNICAIITDVRETQTRKDGTAMGIVKAEFDDEEVSFAVFPKQWGSHKFLFKDRNVGILKLRRTERGLHFNSGVKLS